MLVIKVCITNKFGGNTMNLRVKTIDEKTIKRLADEYLSDICVTINFLASKYRSTSATISNILWRGIAENIIEENAALSIYDKIVHKPAIGWYKRKLRWDEAFRERRKVIKKQAEELKKDLERQQELDCLYSLRDYYESAIASYDSYFIEEENAPSLDSLKSKLDEVNEKLKNLL